MKGKKLRAVVFYVPADQFDAVNAAVVEVFDHPVRSLARHARIAELRRSGPSDEAEAEIERINAEGRADAERILQQAMGLKPIIDGMKVHEREIDAPKGRLQ